MSLVMLKIRFTRETCSGGTNIDWYSVRRKFHKTNTEAGALKPTIYRICGKVHKDYRIALVADLHNANPEPVLRNLGHHKPDFIIVAGDIVYGTQLDKQGYDYNAQKSMLDFFPNTLSFIDQVNDIAPTFFSYGNHEWLLTQADVDRIKKAGVIILNNNWLEYDGLLIGGLSSSDVSKYWKFQDSYRVEHPEETRGNIKTEYHKSASFEWRKTPEYEWIGDYEAQKGYKILICHHPEHWALRESMLVNKKIDLVLAGHAHGGQIRIGNQEIYTSDQGIFPKYTEGIHEGKQGKMIVSRGLSNPTIVPRLFNPPEMVYIDICSER